VAELPIKMQGILYAVNDTSPEYLLIKRTPEDGDFWQPVTGTVNDGEKLVDCLVREIEEETGITELEDVSECLYKFDWQRSSGERILEFVHAVRIPRDSKVILSPTEHEDYRWCKYDAAQELLAKDNNKKSFQVMNEYLMNVLSND
jgi:8-oxo-dGTP pyrophosphatase MutT (NUDIX family)